MSNFIEFYNSLDTIDLILLWFGILVLIIIIGVSIYLYKKNKQLVSLVKEQKEKIIDRDKLIEESRIKNKENSDKIEELKNINNEKIVKIVDNEINKLENEKKVYNKNVLKDNDRRYQTSPINIVKEKKDNVSFTEELAKKMEEEIKPQTIELTDFEKKQEEEAIISYQELLTSNKDRLYQITDDEETTDFIEELKSFRNEL